MEFVLEENPSTGYEWHYDETIINKLFKVESTYEQYGPDKGCAAGSVGCWGERTFKITAGQKGGSGTLYACYTQPWLAPVSHNVMQACDDCEEIKINVQRDSLAQVHDVKTYDLNAKDQIRVLGDAMRHLTVGDSFKVSIRHNGSIGYGYELVESQDGDYLDISEPVMKRSSDEIMMGADTIAEYTVSVKEAGEGNITFKPQMLAGLEEYITLPTLSFDFTAQ